MRCDTCGYDEENYKTSREINDNGIVETLKVCQGCIDSGDYSGEIVEDI